MYPVLVILLVNTLLLTLVSGAADWDYFTFSQQWPPAVCVEGQREHHKCTVPDEVSSWTIHGLWPTKHGEKGPTSCDPSLPFNLAKLEDIKSQLLKNWPNLYQDTDLSSFWQHEWIKHGTCSVNLNATRDELSYFKTGLLMHQTYNIGRLLSLDGIVPSENNSYTLSQFEDSISKRLKYKPVVECEYNQKTHQHIIFQIEICLDKQFQVVDCFAGIQKKSLRIQDDADLAVVEFQSEPVYKRSHSHHSSSHKYIPQSDCPLKDDIYYPPIGHGDPVFG